MSSSLGCVFPPVALLLGLAACGGGDVCKKYEKDFESCPDDNFTVQDCQEQLANCDSDDEKILDDFYKCAKDEGQFECDQEFTNTQDMFEFLAAIAQCAEPLSGLSPDCQNFDTPQQSP